jgi:hypothetical protein
VRRHYLSLIASLAILLASIWISFPRRLPSKEALTPRRQRHKENLIWTPLVLKEKELYEKTIVNRRIIPGSGAKGEISNKEGDIIVIGIAEIEGKRSAIVNFQRTRGEKKDVIVGEGEDVSGWKVVAIRRKSVVLERGGEKRELEIFSPQGSKRREKLIFKREKDRKKLHYVKPPMRKNPIQESDKLGEPLR